MRRTLSVCFVSRAVSPLPHTLARTVVDSSAFILVLDAVLMTMYMTVPDLMDWTTVPEPGYVHTVVYSPHFASRTVELAQRVSQDREKQYACAEHVVTWCYRTSRIQRESVKLIDE
jgi:hypothetical protein